MSSATILSEERDGRQGSREELPSVMQYEQPRKEERVLQEGPQPSRCSVDVSHSISMMLLLLEIGSVCAEYAAV